MKGADDHADPVDVNSCSIRHTLKVHGKEVMQLRHMSFEVLKKHRYFREVTIYAFRFSLKHCIGSPSSIVRGSDPDESKEKNVGFCIQVHFFAT
jgi:hypothetical protein